MSFVARRKLARNGYEMFAGSPPAVTELIKKDLARWTTLAKAAGLKVE